MHGGCYGLTDRRYCCQNGSGRHGNTDKCKARIHAFHSPTGHKCALPWQHLIAVWMICLNPCRFPHRVSDRLRVHRGRILSECGMRDQDRGEARGAKRSEWSLFGSKGKSDRAEAELG